MSVEIEAKMRLADPDAMEAKLSASGARRMPALFEVNTYFDTHQRGLKSADEGLRIRIEKVEDGSQNVTLTHKGPRAHGQLKSRSENEVGVDNAQAAADLLKGLGYMPVLSFEKHRRRWELDGCRVELDSVPHLGDFIEIEGPSDEAVLRVREKLGLENESLIRASYVAMLATYLREHHLNGQAIRFETTKRGGMTA